MRRANNTRKLSTKLQKKSQIIAVNWIKLNYQTNQQNEIMGDPDGTITNWVINGSMSRAQRSISDPFSDQLLLTNGQGKFIVTFESLDIYETLYCLWHL